MKSRPGRFRPGSRPPSIPGERYDFVLVLVVITALAFDFTNGFAAIERLTHEEPSAADIDHVREHIGQIGWDPVSAVTP